ncbi:penicillin-binding protein, beta-lactamase class C [Pseudomonas sp. GM78]|uniref:serine hydrolase domain-containing protein n=1 Tax=Pseudomonas sp. GM78 TaxID=1144337 RepID=UPI0002708265|nr:serine hydrolase domain-containing protein [Pseudomonas sp. GM78]EJN27367.1 penicillin-binding protein, beta-lactamase class C [Pseudomonas sp. GM78]
MLFALVSNGALLTPEQPDTTVPWWSFSKTVLAAAALTLVRDRLVNLDDRVAEGPFTLRQLLRHEAGLADYSELADYHAAVANNEAPWSADDMLQRLDASRLRYTPGDGWRYSNVGYLFIARLIERTTGLPLEEALKQRVFSPLGLSRVRLARTPSDLAGVNMGAASAYDPGWVYHGLLVGPLAEAALFLNRLLGGDLLPQSLLLQMQTVRTLGGPIPGRPWTSPGYGLGLMQGGVEGHRILSGHTGVGPGSVVAVYQWVGNDHNSSCCAVFDEGANEGAVEAEVVKSLSAIDGMNE